MSSKHIYCVYKHTSPSGKSYIGLTCDYDDRCYRHQLKSSRCRFFAFAIKKYGWDNFTHEILYDNLTEYQANQREQQSINEYGSMAPYGYNLISGGGSRSPSLETRRKISATTTGRKRKPDSPEMLALKSRRMTGTTPDETTKAKMSAVRQGATLADSHKQTISAALKGVPKINRGKAVVQLTLDGSELQVFANAAAAQKSTGIRPTMCLNGYTKSAGGFIWRYA